MVGKISPLAEDFMTRNELKYKEAHVSMESSCGPLMIISFPRWSIIQHADGGVAVLDVVPYPQLQTSSKQQYQIVVRQSSESFESFVIHKQGVLLYFRDTLFLKNQVQIQQADNTWKCDFFKDEQVTCVRSGRNLLFGTTHGRISKVFIVNGDIEIQENFTSKLNADSNKPKAVPRDYFQQRDAHSSVQMNTKPGFMHYLKQFAGNQQDQGDMEADSGDFVQAQSVHMRHSLIQKLDVLEQIKAGIEEKIIQIQQNQNHIYCLTAKRLHVFAASSIRAGISIDLKFLRQFSFVPLEEIEEIHARLEPGGAKNGPGKFLLASEDFDVIVDDEVVLLARFLNTTKKESYSLVLVRLDLKTKRSSVQFLFIPDGTNQTNTRKSQAAQRDAVDEVVKACDMFFKDKSVGMDLGAGTPIQLLYNSKFKTQLNIKCGSTLLAVPFLDGYAENLQIKGVPMEEFIQQLFSQKYKLKSDRRSALNQIPDQVRKLLVQQFLRKLPGEAVKLIDPEYRFSWSADQLKMYIGYPSIKITSVQAQKMSLTS